MIIYGKPILTDASTCDHRQVACGIDARRGAGRGGPAPIDSDNVPLRAHCVAATARDGGSTLNDRAVGPHRPRNVQVREHCRMRNRLTPTTCRPGRIAWPRAARDGGSTLACREPRVPRPRNVRPGEHCRMRNRLTPTTCRSGRIAWPRAAVSGAGRRIHAQGQRSRPSSATQCMPRAHCRIREGGAAPRTRGESVPTPAAIRLRRCG